MVALRLKCYSFILSSSLVLGDKYAICFMGKFILSLLILSFPYMASKAQDADFSKMEVRYLVTYVADTVKNTVLADTFCLRFNDEKSLFYELDAFKKDSLRCNDIEKWSEMMGKTLSTPRAKDKGGAFYYVLTDYLKDSYTYQEEISTSSYRYSDNIPSFAWQIHPEYKTILNSRCQKATGKYMGRIYEAWFATDLSAKAAPWKFYGLPGLVMEAYDSRQQYTFTALGIQTCSGKMALFPVRHFKTTKDKFLKEQALYFNDPIGYQEHNALIKIRFGNSSQELKEEIDTHYRHLPMELY